MKEKNNCFLCLNNVSNKNKNRICSKCKCYGHTSCISKYIQNESKMYMILYSFKIILSTPYYIKCPQCRNKIYNLKPVTRSDTKFVRIYCLLKKMNYKLDDLHYENNIEEKIIKLKQLVKLAIEYKSIILDYEHINLSIKSLIKNMYINYGWFEGGFYYKLLYNENI